MTTNLQRCAGCRIERENCVQRRDGSWRCQLCVRKEWERIKRRLVFRSELAATARTRLRRAREARGVK
jgi:hypothetical protein